jgi:hypothetical protein
MEKTTMRHAPLRPILVALMAAACSTESGGPGNGNGGSGPEGGSPPTTGGRATGGISSQGGNGGAATGGATTGGAVVGGTGGGGGNPTTGGAGTGGGGGAARDGGADVAARDGSADAAAQDSGGTGSDVAMGTGNFSFFYTSLEGVRRLSGSQNGFGGNLKFGMPTGLEGADKICQTLAADEGFGHKTWRAFLSVVMGPEGTQVDAIDRVGNGPWYDRRGRLISMTKAGLTSGNRPAGDPQAVNDLADEKGRGRPTSPPNDTHDVITGSNAMGRLRYPGNRNNTCLDWTSTTTPTRPTIGMGHAWPAGSGQGWIQVHTEPNCAAGVNLVQNGPGNGSSIGAGGGWGGFYCFALSP